MYDDGVRCCLHVMYNYTMMRGQIESTAGYHIFAYTLCWPTSAAKVKVTVLLQQGRVLNKVKRQLIRK